MQAFVIRRSSFVSSFLLGRTTRLKMLREKRLGQLVYARVGEAAVAGTYNGVEGNRYTGLAQRRIQQYALLVGNQRVVIAMHDQEWRRIACHIRDWVDLSDSLSMLLDRATDQLRLGRIGRVMQHTIR